MSAMFGNSINTIKSALSPVCRVLDSFESINMAEHFDEVLCFVGTKDYKAGEICFGANGNRFLIANVTLSVDILADRKMTAAELKTLADSTVMITLANLGLNILSIQRKECAFSKAHSRFMTTVELVIEDKIPMSAVIAPTVLLNGIAEPMFTTHEITKGTKTVQTPLVNKAMLSGKVCPVPNKVSLSGKLLLSEVKTALTRFDELSGVVMPLIIGSNVFTNMLLTNISLKQTGASVCQITLELTEVNE